MPSAYVGCDLCKICNGPLLPNQFSICSPECLIEATYRQVVDKRLSNLSNKEKNMCVFCDNRAIKDVNVKIDEEAENKKLTLPLCIDHNERVFQSGIVPVSSEYKPVEIPVLVF